MSPINSKQTPYEGSGPSPMPPSVPSPRRIDPRLWALLPIVALLILGAYLLGKQRNDAETPAPTLPVVQAPPPAPRGQMLVTEVPHPVTITPVTPPAPPPTPGAGANAPFGSRPFKQVEPAVVLPTPSDTPDGSGDSADNASGEPGNPSGTDGGSAASAEPDRDPVKINDPAQEYPSSAYEEGVEGTARVSFTVTEEGAVADAQIDESSGDGRLDQAALDYVKRLRFRPAVRNGQPAAVRATRSVLFSLR